MRFEGGNGPVCRTSRTGLSGRSNLWFHTLLPFLHHRVVATVGSGGLQAHLETMLHIPSFNPILLYIHQF